MRDVAAQAQPGPAQGGVPAAASAQPVARAQAPLPVAPASAAQDAHAAPPSFAASEGEPPRLSAA